MKLSWKASKSYTGFVKFIGKMAGTGSPRCFYLGRDRSDAELSVAKLTVAYRQTAKVGLYGLDSHDLRNRLGHVMLVMEAAAHNMADVPSLAEDASDLRAARSSMIETVEAMERILAAERLRNQTALPEVREVALHQLASTVTSRLRTSARCPQTAVVGSARRTRRPDLGARSSVAVFAG